MATVVTANCPRCNCDIKIRPEGVHIFAYNTKWPGDYYAFFCPKCRNFIQKDADDHATSILVNAGVQCTMIEVPLEVIERKAWKVPLTADDLLNLMDYLKHHETMPQFDRRARR